MATDAPEHCQKPDCEHPVFVGIGTADEGPQVWVCEEHFAEALTRVGDQVVQAIKRVLSAPYN